jgi:hypothetical protein
MAQSVISFQTEKVLEQLKRLDEIAAEKKWVFRVNELDQAIFSPDRVPSGSILFPIDDEKNLYIDADSNVNGIFIEYFSTNFLQHETQFKPLSNELKTRNSGYKVLKDDSPTAQGILSQLEKEIFNDFKQSMQEVKTVEVKL